MARKVTANSAKSTTTTLGSRSNIGPADDDNLEKKNSKRKTGDNPFLTTKAMNHTDSNTQTRTPQEADIGNNVVLQQVLKQLRPFQRQAYEYATQGTLMPQQVEYQKKHPGSFPKELLGQGRILLADEMGLGKTISSLAIMTHYQHQWPLLILCPASLRHTWPGEIEKFLPSLPPSAVYVIKGFDDVGFDLPDPNDEMEGVGDEIVDTTDMFGNNKKKKKISKPKIQIVVATYSLLQQRSAVAQKLNDYPFQCVICDESHHLKQRTSQRTQLALDILQHTKRLVLLSGTPALARPVELWTQISTIAPPNWLTKSYTQFTQRYCDAKPRWFGRGGGGRGRGGPSGWDVSGLSNAEELHTKLQPIMVRRLKADVLHELPAKQRSIVPIDIPKNSQARKDCQDIMKQLQQIRQQRNGIGDLFISQEEAQFESRKLLMQGYQASGIAKAPGVCDYLLEWLQGSDSQKVLVFAHHKGVLNALEVAMSRQIGGGRQKATPAIGYIRIDGSTPSAERAAKVRKFQTSSQIRVALLSMTAAGVGLTLTAATTVMFAELHWTPGVLAQAEDRCHRIGQRNAVHVLYLVSRQQESQRKDGGDDSCFWSVDPILWDILGRKIGTLGKVVDGTKKARLEATVLSKPDDGNSHKPNRSVEEELQSFFAATSATSSSKSGKSLLVPIKGTIMSFFQKQNQKSKQQQSQSTSKPSPPSSSTSLSASRGASSNPTTPTSVTSHQRMPLSERAPQGQQLSPQPHQQPKEEGRMEWACEACTFFNSQWQPQRFSRRSLTCEMCRTPYSQLAAEVIDMTPASSSRGTVTPQAMTPDGGRKQTQASQECEAINAISASGTKASTQSHHPPETIVLDDSTTASSCFNLPGQVVAYSSPPDTIDLLDDDEHEPEDRRNRANSRKTTSMLSARKNPEHAQFTPSMNRTLPQSSPPTSASGRNRISPSTTTPSPKKQPFDEPILSFSVSKNSGRIMLHKADSGESLLINFDIEDILTEETVDQLLEVKVHRSNTFGTNAGKNRNTRARPRIEFASDAIQRLIQRLNLVDLSPSKGADDCQRLVVGEIETFLSQYLCLREVEKQAVRDSGQTFSGSQLKQTIMRLPSSSKDSSSNNPQITERYIGGAKERANKQMEKGLANENDLAVLKGDLCAWCGGSMPQASKRAGVISTYCSHHCAQQGRLKRGGIYASTNVRTQMFALEGGVCQKCGIDAHALFTRICALAPAERLNALINGNWKLPKTSKSLERLLQDPKEGDFWQADHIQAVADGGGGCDLENLQTLCVPCHHEETEKLRAHLKRRGPIEKDPISGGSNDGNKKRQRDIRSMFPQATSTKTSVSSSICTQNKSKCDIGKKQKT